MRVVSRPLPSILTVYWWYWSTSVTTPVWSHLPGWWPCWFWTWTRSPHRSGERPPVCSVHLPCAEDCRFLIAVWRRFSEGSSWGTWSLCGRVGSRSLVGRPRTHIAGDILVSGLGALRYVSRALKKEDLRVPPGPVLPAIRRFIVLTAVSALLFECGWYAEHSLCCTPQLVRNSAVKWAVNSGPPSVVMVSGMPKEANVSLSTAVRPAAPPVAGATMGQPENRSTTTR